MKRILFVSTQKELIEDLDAAFLFGTFPFTLTSINAIENLDEYVEKIEPDILILAYDVLILRDSWNIPGTSIAYCAKTREDLNKGAAYNLPTIGLYSKAADLIAKMETEPYLVQQQNTGSDPDPLVPVQEKTEKASKTLSKGQKEERKEKSEIQTEAPIQDKTSFFGPQMHQLEELEEDSAEDFLNSLNTEIQNSQENNIGNTENIIEKELKKDMGRAAEGKKTRVITVYSAKGGVGKTTLSSELAIYLSLVQVSEKRLQVCLLDNNIDFGNVATTVNVSANKANLTYWADEIKEELRTKNAEDILYTKEDIRKRLVRDPQSGLYVLPAPASHEDSTDIPSIAIEIIMKNIIQNGDFDIVICDTGNNTRDSTMTAIQCADLVLFIMTQSVSTYICDTSFLDTMNSVKEISNFDLGKIKLVINMIMPAKATGLSVQEVVEALPYECVGKIRFNADVIKASNLGEPLALQPNHEFTKQLRSIVSYILQNDGFETETEQKAKKGALGKGFFSLFKKKRDEQN